MLSSVRTLDLGPSGSSRESVRLWSGSGRLFYIAAFRPWVDWKGHSTYFSMAFPLPSTQLMVLLRLRNVGAGLTFSSDDRAPAGTYVIVAGAGGFVALPGPPTSETLSLDVKDGTIACRHVDNVRGRLAFSLDYRVTEVPDRSSVR